MKAAKPYKDSKVAFYEKEEGDEDELVTVIDSFTNGTSIEFTWHRKTSNENICRPGDGKNGFSFYFARRIYRDPYIWKRPDLAADKNNTADLGRIGKAGKKAMLIVQVKEIEKGKIHIVSAAYVTKPEIERDYYIRALDMLDKEKGTKDYLVESTGDRAIKEALIYLQGRR